MKRKNNFDGIIDSFDNNEKNGSEEELLGLINGESDPKAEKIERFVKKTSTITLICLLVAEFILMVVLLCIASRENIIYDGAIGIRGVLNSAGIGSVGNYEKLVCEKENLTEAEKFLLNYTSKESVTLSMLSPSFVSFVQHDYNVKLYNGGNLSSNIGDILVSENTVSPNLNTKEPVIETKTPETEKPSASPNEKPTEVPTADPVVSGDKYYLFNLENYMYTISENSADGSITSGILSDNCTEKELIVGDRDFAYGSMVIQNPHGVEAFNLRDVLSSPLIIPECLGTGSEQIMLYYTHTSEGYCNSEGEKNVSKNPSISSSDNTKNVVSCGTIIAEELEKYGVGVLNRIDVNDEDYNTAYDVSGQLLKDVTGVWDKLDLAIDIHSDSLEYPAGTWYGPVTESEGVAYAKVLFVITVGEGNPNWQENLKLAMLLIDRLEAKVPGITRGISLRTDSKYNSTVTDKGLLVEMGFNGNLVTEAHATAKVFGEVLGEIYG